jgi:hypothetical protein
MDFAKASPPPLVAKIRINAYYLVLVVIAFIYYIFLIAGHSFRLFEPTELGMSFNSMLEHLLRGQFDIDPHAIRFEGFVRNGKTYSYFGIFLRFCDCLYMLSVICGTMLHVSIALSQQRLAWVFSLRAWR